MNQPAQSLGIELRHRPSAEAAHWSAVLAAVVRGALASEPRFWVDRTSADIELAPWTGSLADELARRSAAGTVTSWLLAVAPEGVGGISWDVRTGEVALSLAIPRPEADAIAWVRAFLGGLGPEERPAMAMVFDLDSRHDAEVIFQGLGGLTQLPPLLYLDAASASRLDAARLQRSGAAVHQVAGGMLIVSRPDPFAPRTGQQLRRSRSAEHALGISPETPLIVSGEGP